LTVDLQSCHDNSLPLLKEKPIGESPQGLRNDSRTTAKVIQNNPAASPKASAILRTPAAGILTVPDPTAFLLPIKTPPQMRCVFTTPLVTPLLRHLARAGLWACGWRMELGQMPKPPYVFIGAPHTSNWDFFLMLAAVLSLGLHTRWLGKDSLFRPPFGGLMTWLGGIPVDRSHSQNLVTQTAMIFKQYPDLVICIPPEGTRKKVDRWKTGFYYIALQARVPIMMTVIDAETRSIRLLGQYNPTGDVEREIREIQRHYRGFRGLIPENSFELQE
jgi:1-acyl-sn-glycerol-3-phosphate acyltransferase